MDDSMDSPPPHDDDSDIGGTAALSSDGDDAEDCSRTARRRNRERRHLENLYGSFLDDVEDNSDGDDGGARGGRFRARKRPRAGGGFQRGAAASSSSSGSAPVFVRTTHAEEELPLAAKDVPQKVGGAASPIATATDQQGTVGPGDPSEEEDPEEMERRRQVREANERFWALLQKGQGRTRQLRETVSPQSSAPAAAAPVAPPPPQPEALIETEAQGGLGVGGLGLGSSTVVPAGSVPAAFGGFRPSKRPERSSATPAPAVASWEKHTKGIGSKLLAKMGYSGRGGLQKKRPAAVGAEASTTEAAAVVAPVAATPLATGIAQPIQVKVRPTGLGLGFGNFQEASSLKQNRQIEAQVRGAKPDDEDAARADASATGSQPVSSALLPSVKDLIKEQSWRRGSKKRKNKKSSVVPFTELLEQQQASKEQVIIDMRGPQVEDLMDESDEAVPLGVELLHNVSLLLSTYENKIYSASSFLESTKSQISSIESDASSINEQLAISEERTKKLKQTRSILSQIEDLTGGASLDGSNSVLERLGQLLRELGGTFTPNERADLKFSEVLIPTIFASIVQSKMLDTWKPLKDSKEQSKAVLTSIVAAAKSVCISGGTNLASLLQTCLLPKIKTSFESVRWDPVLDVDGALDIFEMVFELFSNIDKAFEQNRREPEDEDGVFGNESPAETLQLVETAKEVVVYDVVYNKLIAAISQWKPQLDHDGRILNRIDLWVLPWLPYLDHEGLLPHLVSDCKRKVRNSISFLCKHVKNDQELFASVIETLKPWRGVLKEKTLQDMVSSDVLPRLARSIQRKQNLIEAASSNWYELELLLRFNYLRLLSDIEFLSLVEGELLWVWCDEIHRKLTVGLALTDVAGSYVQMKEKILGNGKSDSDFVDASRRLYEDDMICRYFYSVLLMLQAIQSTNGDLESLAPVQSSMHTVLSRRKKEEKQRIADDLVRMDKGFVGPSDIDMEARVRLHRAGPVVTFREVVEELANERGILFQPKQGASNTKDGKPVYMLGEVPIYFDSDVVFAYEAGRWAPVPLQGLINRAQ